MKRFTSSSISNTSNTQNTLNALAIFVGAALLVGTTQLAHAETLYPPMGIAAPHYFEGGPEVNASGFSNYATANHLHDNPQDTLDLSAPAQTEPTENQHKVAQEAQRHTPTEPRMSKEEASDRCQYDPAVQQAADTMREAWADKMNNQRVFREQLIQGGYSTKQATAEATQLTQGYLELAQEATDNLKFEIQMCMDNLMY